MPAAVKAHEKWTFTVMKVYSSMKIHAFLSCIIYIGTLPLLDDDTDKRLNILTNQMLVSEITISAVSRRSVPESMEHFWRYLWASGSVI